MSLCLLLLLNCRVLGSFNWPTQKWGFFPSCLWILWIMSGNQVETERWAVLLNLSFPMMPVIMVFEYSYLNKLGNQQTDLHIAVRNGYKLYALNFKSLCVINCLLSIVHMNKCFPYSHNSGKLSSEKQSELCSTSPLVHQTVIPLTPTYKHNPTQSGSIWPDAHNPWKLSIILKPNFPIPII